MKMLTHFCHFLIQLLCKSLSDLDSCGGHKVKRLRDVTLIAVTLFPPLTLPPPTPIKFQLDGLKVNFVRGWPVLSGLTFMLQAFQSYTSPPWCCHQTTPDYKEFLTHHSSLICWDYSIPLACLLLLMTSLPYLTMSLWSVDDITLLPLNYPACASVFSSPYPHVTMERKVSHWPK